ncbi:alpha/beta hydrolase [Streptomyces sp. NPDC020794]|uniref:alpha/beta hydrolase n=1 Tax=unclassified Streptomyces TaxID=2593676 RepID=UPI0036F006F0
MTTAHSRPSTFLPAREIPIPTSVSPEAQALLAQPTIDFPGYPALDDPAGWRAVIAAQNQQMLAFLTERTSHVAVDTAEVDLDGAGVFVVTPQGTLDTGRVFLYIHGGALTAGGGACCRALGVFMANRVGARTWAVDYRMPPDHPYPTPLDDCVSAYRKLLQQHRPEDIVVGGDSAGGNLAAALILRARDEGLPLPAAAVLFSPEVDLTESGDSFQTNLGVDIFLTQSLMPINLLYAAGHDLTDPYLSPLFGDFSKGFPPTLLITGTRDLFLSNAVRMHRALRTANIPAELHVMEAGPHGGFLGMTPEDDELDREARRFMEAHWPR